MKNMIKKSLVGFGLAIGLLALGNLKAAEISLTLTNATTNVLFTSGMQISQITVTAPTTNAALVLFYDSALGNTYTNGAWVSRTTVSTNISTVFTNTVGLVQTNIYTGIFTYATTNAASTNVYPVEATFSVPQASSTTRFESIVNARGLVAIPNTNGIVVTVIYEPTQNQ